MNIRTPILTLVLMGIALVCGAQTPQNLPFGAADYDSGWVVVNMSLMTLNHGLGGDVDDYFVNLEFRYLSDGEGAPGVHNTGMGCDTSGSVGNEERGAEIYGLSSSTVNVWVGIEDMLVDEIRVRIWRVSNPAWDSGWTTPTRGDTTMTHSLGGNPDDYLVDLSFKNDGGTIHKRSIGLDDYITSALETKGGGWHSLDNSLIRVRVGSEDTHIDQIRVRIFLPPAPSYTSGWFSLVQGTTQTLTHDLGGPWNDFLVVMDHKDSSHSWGINKISSGGDSHATNWYGADWTNLDAQQIRVHRFSNDYVAEQVRIRIWASRAPAWDSGWTTISQGTITGFAHGLGGVADFYVVDMQFKDSDNTLDAGINQGSYGIDRMYNSASSQWDIQGAAWHNLTSNGIYVERGQQDVGSDEVRIRIWQAPDPDFDSGWNSIGAGVSETLTHGVGGASASSYIVDLQCREPGWGVNQRSFGEDRSLNSALDAFEARGAFWKSLGLNAITVQRNAEDASCEEYRIRIWNGTNFEWSGVRTMAAPWSHVFTHNLDSSPDDIVVSVAASDSSDSTYHARDFGEDRMYWGGINYYGILWDNLTSNTIKLWRGADDSTSDGVYVRLWWTGSGAIFSDDFESGLTTAWSDVVGCP